MLVSTATPTGFAEKLWLILPPLLTHTYLGTDSEADEGTDSDQ